MRPIGHGRVQVDLGRTYSDFLPKMSRLLDQSDSPSILKLQGNGWSAELFTEFRRAVLQVLSDNITTVAFINFLGDQSPNLDSIARTIWRTVIQHNIQISARFSKGDELNSRRPHLENASQNVFIIFRSDMGPTQYGQVCIYARTTMCKRCNSAFDDTQTPGHPVSNELGKLHLDKSSFPVNNKAPGHSRTR